MSMAFTLKDVEAIRTLYETNNSPSDSEIARITDHPIKDVRAKLQAFHTIILDKQISTDRLWILFNEEELSMKPKLSVLVPSIEDSIQPPILSASATIPPKFRGKTFSKTPVITSAQHNPFSQASKKHQNFPIYPMIATKPMMGHELSSNKEPPKIGSLAAIIHPNLGPAHVCRVLGSKIWNGQQCYLLGFFQNTISPCYVPGEYLQPLESHTGFPIGDEERFDIAMQGDNITVDWLLERIFSSAQNLVISHAEVLFPPDQVAQSKVKPTPNQVQQVMFQCVSAAALLLACYVGGKYSIPEPKMIEMINTILKMNPSKFMSTQNIMSEAEKKVFELIGIHQ